MIHCVSTAWLLALRCQVLLNAAASHGDGTPVVQPNRPHRSGGDGDATLSLEEVQSLFWLVVLPLLGVVVVWHERMTPILTTWTGAVPL